MTEADEIEAIHIRKEIIDCPDPFIIVEGPAGCGKSTLAIDKAQHQLGNKEASVLVCGHLNSTRIRLGQQLHLRGIGTDNTFVTTIDALILDIVKRHTCVLGISVDSLYGLDKDICCIDFVQIEEHGVRLCERHPSIGKSYGRKYPLILIDEFQDLNPAQYKFIRLLASYSQVLAFGDGNQAILADDKAGWDIIEQARKDGATYFCLPHIPGCNRFDSHVLGQLELELRSKSGNAIPLDPAVTLKQFHDPSHPEVLAGDIALACVNRRGRTTAVIVETRSLLARLKQELTLTRPPVYCMQVVPKDQISKAYNGIETVGRLLFDPNSDVVQAHMVLLAWVFKQRVAEGNPFRNCIKEYCENNPIESINVNILHPPQEIIQFIENRLGGVSLSLVGKYQSNQWSIEFAKSLIERLLRRLRNTTVPRIGNLVQWRRWISLQHAASLASSYDSDFEQTGKVLLLTVHQAKNRQFDRTIVVLEPYTKPVSQEEAFAKVYVGCTRARNKLTIFRPSTGSQMWSVAEPYFSKYVVELDEYLKKKGNKKRTKRPAKK